jgi:hypothetical protein
MAVFLEMFQSSSKYKLTVTPFIDTYAKFILIQIQTLLNLSYIPLPSLLVVNI